MTENEIFNRALNVGTGWEVYSAAFNLEQKELRIHIRTVKGSLHTCGTCGKAGCRNCAALHLCGYFSLSVSRVEKNPQESC